MSGDGNYSGSGGFDLNAFGDWGACSTLWPVRRRRTPKARRRRRRRRTKHHILMWMHTIFPSSPPRPTQGLSLIRENFPEEHTPEYFPMGGRQGGGGFASRETEEEQGEEEEEEDLGRHPYSRKETLALYAAWLTVSYDPIVGNQQTRLCFWEKVTEVYEQTKPKGARRRNVKMLRSHFDRCDRDVKKFCSIYRAEAEHYQSGASGADILRAAMRVFKDDVKKDFKHIDVWELVRDEERWAGGVRSSSSSSKRTKHTGGGYSSSDGGGSGNASQEFEDTPTDVGGSSSGSRRRPQGTKAAKAARGRGRGKGKGRGQPSQVGSGSSTSLWSIYMLATMADTSRMTPPQYEAHIAGMQEMARQLGIPPSTNSGAPPPTSGDDSPAE